MKRRLFYVLVILIAVSGLGFYVKKGVFVSNEQPYVTLTGPIVMADGIGRQLVELANVLIEDFSVSIYPNHVDRTDVPVTVLDKINKSPKQLGKVIVSEESLWYPGDKIYSPFQTVTQKDQLRISYSMLESTLIPPEWVMKLNLYYDMVVVPDQFLVDVYKNSGVQIPVFLLPLGLDLQNFLDSPIKQKRNPIMVFANLSSCLDRKNHILLMRAFAKALGNRPDAALRINCRSAEEGLQESLQEELANLKCFNIYLTEFKLKKDAYLKFFQGVDCYVSLSKGEGYSIQPREAMALGIPVIATDNTAQTTICKTGLVKAVKSALPELAYYSEKKIPTGYRFNCEEKDVIDSLLDVYNNYESYLQNASQARQWAASFDYSTPALKKMYKTMVKPSKIILGNEDKIYPDYIVTTSQALYEKYQAVTLCEGENR